MSDYCPKCGVGVTVVCCERCGATICTDCGAVWEDEEGDRKQ